MKRMRMKTLAIETISIASVLSLVISVGVEPLSGEDVHFFVQFLREGDEIVHIFVVLLVIADAQVDGDVPIRRDAYQAGVAFFGVEQHHAVAHEGSGSEGGVVKFDIDNVDVRFVFVQVFPELVLGFADTFAVHEQGEAPQVLEGNFLFSGQGGTFGNADMLGDFPEQKKIQIFQMMVVVHHVFRHDVKGVDVEEVKIVFEGEIQKVQGYIGINLLVFTADCGQGNPWQVGQGADA